VLAEAPAPHQREWTIRSGEHLWAIAEAIVAEANGDNDAPPAAQTDPYWRRLIAANRDRLADPANPDLVFPGQTIVVPLVSVP